jgi:hypothetical protein
LFGKLKKKLKKKEVKTDLPYLSFYEKKPETHIFFFGLAARGALRKPKGFLRAPLAARPKKNMWVSKYVSQNSIRLSCILRNSA